MTDCTETYFHDSKSYQIVQVTVLLLMLLVILLVNFLALSFTYYTKYTSGCVFSRVLSASYIGNIMAGFSLFAGELRTTYEGEMKLECSHTRDRHFFFYMGITINMCILVTNTYVRYKLLKKLRVPQSSVSLLVQLIIPSWIVSAVLSTVVVVVQLYTSDYFLFTSLVITIPMLTFVIIYNCRLTKVLQVGKENSRTLNQASSEERLKRATSIIQRITYVQAFYLVIWVTVAILTIKLKHYRDTYIVMLWISRFVFFLSFVLEAKIFIHKNPEVRKAMRQAARTLLCSFCENDTRSEKTATEIMFTNKIDLENGDTSKTRFETSSLR